MRFKIRFRKAIPLEQNDLCFGTCYEVNIEQICPYSIYKYNIMLMLLRLSGSAQCWRSILLWLC